MAVLPDVITDRREDIDSLEGIIQARKVVLHNCDCHSFAQVIRALVKVLNMSADQAEQTAWTVHLTGSAVVYEGDLERCELVARELEAWAGPGQNWASPQGDR